MSDAEEVMPSRTTKRTRHGASGPVKTVVKKAPRKPFHKWKPEEYQTFREENPYEEASDYRGNNHFYSKDQELVYKEVYIHKDYSVTLQHTINFAWVMAPKRRDYFAEAFAMAEEFGLYPLMKFNHNYIEYYILQFFSTVYFEADDARSLKWMTKNHVLECTLKEFGEMLGYPDSGSSDPSGWRAHENELSSSKDSISEITMVGGTCGKTAHLCQPFEILHRIYRETLMPRVGNWDEVHGYMIDLLKISKEKQGTGQKIDVMDVIYNELWYTVIDKRAPIFGPFIMKLIRKKYLALTKEDIMKEGLPIIKHLSKDLRVKSHKVSTVTAEPSAPSTSRVGKRASASRASASSSSDVEPSWFKQFKDKAKQAFCFNSDRAYEAHVAQKKAAARQKEMMRSMQLDVSPGSEGVITPEEDWKAAHGGYWSESDIPVPPHHEDQDEE